MLKPSVRLTIATSDFRLSSCAVKAGLFAVVGSDTMACRFCATVKSGWVMCYVV